MSCPSEPAHADVSRGDLAAHVGGLDGNGTVATASHLLYSRNCKSLSTASIPMYRFVLPVLFILGTLYNARAQEPDPAVNLTIRNHQFSPTEVEIPAGVKVQVIVRNEDATAEEFESDSLRREKIVAPGQSITVFVGPLKTGSYEFYGDFHQDTARGHLIAK